LFSTSAVSETASHPTADVSDFLMQHANMICSFIIELQLDLRFGSTVFLMYK